MQVGDRVSLPHIGSDGIIRFIGTVHYAKGEFIGVELDDAKGKNNGTVKGQTYFECEENHGVFVRPDMIISPVGKISSNPKTNTTVSAEDINIAEAEKIKGNEYFAKKEFEEAHECYSRAINACPSNHLYYSNRAACSLELNLLEDAVDDCDNAIELCPTFLKTHMRRAKALELLGLWDDALVAYDDGERMVDKKADKEKLRKLKAECKRGKATFQKAGSGHRTAATSATAAPAVPPFVPAEDMDWFDMLPADLQAAAMSDPKIFEQVHEMLMSGEFDGDDYGEGDGTGGFDPFAFGSEGMMGMPMEDESDQPKTRLKKPVMMFLPLHEAVKAQNISQVESCIKDLSDEKEIDELDDHGRSALAWACHFGNLDIAKMLISNGAAINAYDPTQQYETEPAIPVFEAVSSKKMDLIQYLVESGADCSIKEPILGHNVMHIAVKSGEMPIIEFLLEKLGGRSANVEDMRGISALGLACRIRMNDESQRFVILDTMFGKGAVVDCSVLLFYVCHSDKGVCQYLQQNHASALDTTANPPLVNASGATLLHLACGLEDKILAMQVLRNILPDMKYAINMKNIQGRTCVYNALQRANKELVRLLVQNGAKINEGDEQGNTVLHLVGETGDQDLWDFLVKLGASTTQPNKEGKPPKLSPNFGENCCIM